MGYQALPRQDLTSRRHLVGKEIRIWLVMVRWIPAKSGQSPSLVTPNFTNALLLFPAGLRRCGGFRHAGPATTFHVFHRLQVTNFSLFKSAPNGANYMDVRRLFLHDRFRLPE